MNSITVLMTGAGAPGAPGILRCYRNNAERNIKVIGVDIKERVPTINALDALEKVPFAQSSDFIKTLLTICNKYNVKVIQPLVTRELEVFAQNIALLQKNGIQVCVSPLANLHIANDKGALLQELEKNMLYIPQYKLVTNPEEFKQACCQLGYPDMPVCFKPTHSNGSRGFRIIDDKKNKADLLFYEKPNSLYMSFDEAYQIIASMEKMPELIIMEFLSGKEYSVDMLVDHGKVLYCIPRLRLTMNGGISTSCIVENNQEVIEYCSVIAEKLKLHGNIGIQVRYSIDDKVGILEINPRVQGSIVACAAAGVNLPYYGIKLALHEAIPSVSVNWGVQMLRSWQEVYFDSTGYAFTF